MARRKDEAKVTFTADTAQFNDAIKAANSTMTKLRSELKLNAAQMKNSGASVESLTESKRILEDQDAALASKVEALNGKLLKAEETWGANSAEAQRYATQLNNARAQQERVRAAIDQASAAIEEQTRAEQEAQGAPACPPRSTSSARRSRASSAPTPTPRSSSARAPPSARGCAASCRAPGPSCARRRRA